MCEPSLNDACFRYEFLLNALRLRAELGRRNPTLERQAEEHAELMRKHICYQFGKPPETTWPNIMANAGVVKGVKGSPTADHIDEKYRISIGQRLDPLGVEIYEKLKTYQDMLTGAV